MKNIKIELGIWSVIAGAVIMVIIGFSAGSWALKGKSLNRGANTDNEAVVSRLAEICLAKYKADPDRTQKLSKMANMNIWEKTEYIEYQGWSIMPFESASDSQVAKKCSVLITGYD